MPDDRLIELVDAVLVDLDGSTTGLDAAARVRGLLARARDQLRDGQVDSGSRSLSEAARVVVDEWRLDDDVAKRICEVSALAERQ